MLKSISHDRLIEIVGTHHVAGGNFVIDPIAAKVRARGRGEKKRRGG